MIRTGDRQTAEHQDAVGKHQPVAESEASCLGRKPSRAMKDGQPVGKSAYAVLAARTRTAIVAN